MRPSRLVAHALVVTALVGSFVALVIATPPGSGANIGLGFVGLPLLLLGLPWSLPLIINPYDFDDLGRDFRYVLTLGAPVLNLVLHALAVAVLGARRHRRS